MIGINTGGSERAAGADSRGLDYLKQFLTAGQPVTARDATRLAERRSNDARWTYAADRMRSI